MMIRRLLALSVLAVGLPLRPAAGQQPRRLDADRIHVILRTIQSDLHRYYYDSTFHGIDIDARFRAAEERAQAAETNHQIFAIIAQTLSELNDSHTTFWPPDRVADVRYGWRPHMVGDTCVIVAVARGSDAERRGVRIGDRVLSIDGIRPNRRDFWKIEYLFKQLDPRGAVRLVLTTGDGPQRQVDVASRVISGRALVNLTGSDGGSDIWDLIRQAGDWEEEHRDEFATVGDTTLVWRLPTFAADDDRIDAGIRRAKRHRTLILDLRGNQGGYERAVLRLIGGTFSADVEVGTLHRRRRTEPLRASAQYEPYQGRIIVLVDSRSASAAEIYAGTVQRLGRGIVLGDRSSGAVMRSRVYGEQAGGEFAVLYALSITDAEIILGDSTRLERQGVTPDETLLPSPEDVATGRDPALARALRIAGHDVDAVAAGRLLRRGWRTIDLW
jgi:C-terminal processing protease CtpA/Prc